MASDLKGLVSLVIDVPNNETVLTKELVNQFFKENPDATHVRIPEGVTTIGKSAFSHCRKLKGIIIPASVTTIGKSAFLHCRELERVTIPKGVTNIAGFLFFECEELKSVTLPESVTAIDPAAFYGCSGLEWVRIPEGVTTIGANAFSGCSGLEWVRIPEGVTTIGDGAFSGCSGLKWVTIPESVTTIGVGAFDGCRGLAILSPGELMEGPQWTSIPGVHLYNRSNKSEVLAFNPFFSTKSFKSNRGLYNNKQRSFIMAMLFVALQLDKLFYNPEPEVVEGDVKNNIQKHFFPHLPTELWIHILEFVQRQDMIAHPVDEEVLGIQVAGACIDATDVDDVSDGPRTNSDNKWCTIL